MTPLYAIVDVGVCAARGHDAEAVAAAFVRAGVDILQLRAKDLGAAEYLALAVRLAPLAAATGATLVVNDRVDVARTAGLGVHLGQDDLPAVEARRLLGPAAVIGLSTHSAEQLTQAVTAPVSYVAYGPVFATGTKADPDPVVGLAGIRHASRLAEAASLPLVAIGGITLENARAVTAAGATAVAVISDLLRGAGGPEARARQFLSALSAEPV